MNRSETAELIKKHEGIRYRCYADTTGILTIGIGFNLQKPGARARIGAVGANYDQVASGSATLSQAQVLSLFAIDLDDAIQDAQAVVKNFNDHPDPIQSVIVDMIFNIGAQGFARFRNTIAAFERKDYCGAAAEMGDSLWAAQVPNRAKEDIAIVMDECQ
jgi:GH24 family phage-related lysozyme (muramidase)